MSEENEVTPKFRTATLEEIIYTRDNPLTVKLSCPVKADGVQYEAVVLIPPTRKQMKSARVAALAEAKKNGGVKDEAGNLQPDGEKLYDMIFMKCCITPIISEEFLENISQADYMRIINEMESAAFFGNIAVTT